MNIHWNRECVARKLSRYASLYVVLFCFSIQANQLRDFMIQFFKRWDIQHPLNEEFSVKFSCQAINPYRYIVCIPRSYVDPTCAAQIDDLLSFVREKKEVVDAIKNYLATENIGWVGYATDFSDQYSLKKKAYFDFGKNSGRGIDSYEWQMGSDRIARRTYANLDTYEPYVAKLLSKRQTKVFNRLKPYLNFEKTLLKRNKDAISLCFAFKNVVISDVQKYLYDLIKEFYINKEELKNLFSCIGSYKITWIYIQQEEVTIYYRKQDWIYHV